MCKKVACEKKISKSSKKFSGGDWCPSELSHSDSMVQMDQLKANYNSSESDTSEEICQEPTPDFPKIPEAILDKYHLKPSVGGGMKPQGFTSFIYLEWRPNKTQRAQLLRVVNHFNKACRGSGILSLRRLRFEPLHLSALGSPEPLHISLTRTLQFSNELQRDLFHQSLAFNLVQSPIAPFEIDFEPSFQVLDSQFRDRMFLTVPVASKLKYQYFSILGNILKDSLRAVFPRLGAQEINSMICAPESVHMSIAVAEGMTSSPLTIFAQEQTPLGPIPSWSVSHMKFDKNRESLKMPFN